MESDTEKLLRLSRDLRQARRQANKNADDSGYLGVGATVRVLARSSVRLISVYGRDVVDGVALEFFENGRQLDARSVYRVVGQSVGVDRQPLGSLYIELLRQSREFRRPDLPFDSHGAASRNEIVFIDDALRHAISQAVVRRPVSDYDRAVRRTSIRLPVRQFNKRLPDHTNALRMWQKYHDSVRPGTPRLYSGLSHQLYQIQGGEYEDSIAIAVEGTAADLANRARYPDGPLLRIHSACSFSEKGRKKGYTSNLERDAAYCQTLPSYQRPFLPFRAQPSDSCDCRLQMEESQRRIAAEGGIFADFYEQEGRGYGLLNKEEFFYRLHDEEGWDTAEVCARYGINPDIRVYDTFAAWLWSFGIRRVRLLGNNPRKRRALEQAGIAVKTIGLWLPTAGNIEYLRTKRDRLDHAIPADAELYERLRGTR